MIEGKDGGRLTTGSQGEEGWFLVVAKLYGGRRGKKEEEVHTVLLLTW